MEQSGDTSASEITVRADGRTFEVSARRFENGIFVSVSEGAPRIGSVAMSLVSQAGAVPVTTVVIPPRDSGAAFFLRMAAEQASSRSGGVAIASVYARGEMGPELSKELLGHIIEMTRYEKRQEGAK